MSAGHHERRLPVVGENRPHDERRREHGADRRADVEEAAGETTLFGGKPLRRRLHPGRVGAAFGEAEQPAQDRERGPAVRQAVRHADDRPGDREHREPGLQPDDVEDVAADRLQHDRALERADDPRVLLRGDVQVLQDGGRGDAERASREVVDDRADHQQRHHPPAQRFHITARSASRSAS